MKLANILVLALVLSVIVIAGCTTAPPEPKGQTTDEPTITQDETMSQIDASLIQETDDVEIGDMIYQINSLHVYSRHFQLLDKMYFENKHLK